MKSPNQPTPPDDQDVGESIVELCTPAAIGQTVKLRAVSDAVMIEELLKRGWSRADA